MTVVGWIALGVLLQACSPFVDRIDLTKVDPAERTASTSVRVVGVGNEPSRVIKTIGDVDAYSCKLNLTDPPASRADAIQQLRLKAYRMGANGVIEVVTDSQGTDAYGTNCWNSVHAAGVAVTLAE